MTKHVASILTANGMSLFIDGQQYSVAKDNPNYSKICDALREKKYDNIEKLLDIRSTVKEYLSKDKDFTLENDAVYLNGEKFSEGVTGKVLSMIDGGFSPEPLFNFLRKVRQNPSAVSQNELLLFCVANGFMIHEDGDIIAYKSVRGDYTDIHTGKIRNAVRDVIELPRHQVDDRRDQTCSFGLHFAAFEYASTWAGEIDGVNRRLMVMKVNPRDVVSIPADYNNQKGRCCRYEVIAELNVAKPIPHKEVLTNGDLGVSCSQCECACRAVEEQVEHFNEEIFERENKMCDLRLAYDNLEASLKTLENVSAREQVNALLDSLTDEIENLETEVGELINERDDLINNSECNCDE